MARGRLPGFVLTTLLAAACGDNLSPGAPGGPILGDDDGSDTGDSGDDTGDGGDDTGDGGDDTGDGGIGVAPECNPLGVVGCALPFPTSLYLADDPASPTGVRVDIPPGALPVKRGGEAIDPALYNQRDGFSPAAPIVAAFGTAVDPSNLPGWTDYEQSLSPDSPTILLDMVTGALVPHFAELDAGATDPADQALYIRPAALLAGGRRYAVAIRKTLRAAGGGELPVAVGLQSIIDGTESGHERLERTRAHYSSIFSALSLRGIEPDDLLVAWDFVTASRESMRSDVVAARDAALELLGTSMADLAIEVTRDQPSADPRFVREIEGTFEAPLLLTDGGEFSLDTRLLRGEDGRPTTGGLYRVPFDAIIPDCALAADAPVPILIYGHGLLGTSDQVRSSGTRTAAAGLCMVAVGTDLRGMSEADAPNVVAVLTNLDRGPIMFEALVQGVVNHISLVQVARARMATELFVDDSGRSLVDPTRIVYYGISQGGIFGGTIAAYDPVIQRAVLQVGAMNYSMLLERSADWPTYAGFLRQSYPRSIDISLILSLLQMQWDTTDPVSVADAVLTGGIPGAPEKQLFLQIGIGDVEVSNLASEYQARSMGIPVLAPTVRQPWGVTEAAGPVPNALAIFDFGLGGTIPIGNQPPPDNEVHGSVRKRQATIEMMRTFYTTGQIVSACGAGGCLCQDGDCGPELP